MLRFFARFPKRALHINYRLRDRHDLVKMPDKVHITGLKATAIMGLDHWKKPVPHPVSLDVSFSTDFSKASDTDDLHYSLNYAVISAKIYEYLDQNRQKNFGSLSGVAHSVFDVLEQERSACLEVVLLVSAPKIDIRAPVSYSTNTGIEGIYDIQGIRALALIGVFNFERANRQYVTLDITLRVQQVHLAIGEVSESVQKYLESTKFKTVEALVKLTCLWIFQNFSLVDEATVRVAKPNAIIYTDGVGVSCLYARKDLVSDNTVVVDSLPTPELFNLPIRPESDYSGKHTVYVAFGSNEGNQLTNINCALQLLNDHAQIVLVSTLALYVSKPMYHLDQADFYNGVIKLIVEDMTPYELLDYLKKIEYEELSRIKRFENGPRSIDLDIILFGNRTVMSDTLIIPHQAMLDRTFVLQPLCELVPPDFIHPVTVEPIHNHLTKLLQQSTDPSVQESGKLVQLVPTAHKRCLEFNLDGLSSTMLMGVFNVTPDLFSDGGERYRLGKSAILEAAHSMKEQGAAIIDVGGVSTRPGSYEPSVEDEVSRILEVIQTIRLDHSLNEILVSADTYRSVVAEKAISAGADIINDISMGRFDTEMFALVARSGCGYIMNHSRGTPATMNQMTTYEKFLHPETSVEYFWDEKSGHLPRVPDSTHILISGVCRELSKQVQAAILQGVRKWQIIVDPGIGFAKTTEQNLALIRHCSRVKKYSKWDVDTDAYISFQGTPMLVGTSRKKFLGTVTNTPNPSDRVIASAASVVACIEQGTDIVRVHDLEETRQAAQTADALYRKP